MSLYPGDGCIIATDPSFTAKFVGRIRQNCVEKTVSSQWAIHSSLVPLSGAVDASLRFPAANGDSISVMTDTSGNYQNYTYNNGTWSPSVPSIPLGKAFWSSKAASTKWRQNFSVW
jgi:hypothetical protein